MIRVVEQRKQQLADLCLKHGVRTLALFGSALTDAYELGRSDLDFVVEFQPMPPAEHASAYFALHRGLQQLFSCPIDLVEIEAVRNPFIKREIESTRENIYAA